MTGEGQEQRAGNRRIWLHIKWKGLLQIEAKHVWESWGWSKGTQLRYMLGAGGHGVSGYMLVQAKSTSLEIIVPFSWQKPCDTCWQLREGRKGNGLQKRCVVGNYRITSSFCLNTLGWELLAEFWTCNPEYSFKLFSSNKSDVICACMFVVSRPKSSKELLCKHPLSRAITRWRGCGGTWFEMWERHEI